MARASHCRERHPLEVTHRLALARPPGEVRPPWQTCFDRFNRWTRDGTWDQLLAHAQTKSDAVGEIEWEVSVDDTVIRALHHGAGASPKRANRRPKRGLLNPEDEALGRSRGGCSTKVHLACAGKGRPLSVVLTPGQRHGSTQLEELLDAVRVARRPQGAPGRPRSKRPAHLLADRGYSFESCRRLVRRRGISHTIPERKDHTKSVVPGVRDAGPGSTGRLTAGPTW
jgi:transposase